MCTVHFMRALLKNIPKKDKENAGYELKEALEGKGELQILVDKLQEMGYSKSAETIERFRFDLWNYKAFPRQHRLIRA